MRYSMRCYTKRMQYYLKRKMRDIYEANLFNSNQELRIRSNRFRISLSLSAASFSSLALVF